MKTEEPTCKELVELVTAYLEGALPPDERARFDEHVRGCTGCAVYLEQMRQTLRLTGMLEEEQVTAEALDALTLAFRDWRRSRHEPNAP